MPSGGGGRHPGAVHFLVAVEHDASGRLIGTVASEAGPPQPFEGWLELARLLEPRGAQDTARQDSASAPPADTRATPEETSEVRS